MLRAQNSAEDVQSLDLAEAKTRLQRWAAAAGSALGRRTRTSVAAQLVVVSSANVRCRSRPFRKAPQLDGFMVRQQLPDWLGSELVRTNTRITSGTACTQLQRCARHMSDTCASCTIGSHAIAKTAQAKFSRVTTRGLLYIDHPALASTAPQGPLRRSRT